MQRDKLVKRVMACVIAATIAATDAAPASTDPARYGDAVHGKALYQGCQACHSVDENDLGPKHRGLVGRRAGSVEDYNYSLPLKHSGLIWDEATLERWLTNPSALVPGTKMFYKIDSPQDRADIIVYLKQLK